MEDWKPEVGDIVFYKNKGSLDYAWHEPTEVEVVAIGGTLAWVSGLLEIDGVKEDSLVAVDNLSPNTAKEDAWEQESRIAGKIWTVLWNTTLTVRQIDEVMKVLMVSGVTFKGVDDDK